MILFKLQGKWKYNGNIHELQSKALQAINKNIIYNEYFRKASYQNLEEALSLVCQFSLAEYANPQELDYLFLPASESTSEGIQYWKTRATKSTQEFALTIVSLINNIRAVNTLPNKELASETLHELYFQIAKSHSAHPELRIEWLNRLQQSHYLHKNYTEAAITNLYIVAILAIPMIKADMGLEYNDLEIISQINPHVISTGDDAIESHDMEKQLVKALEATIECFEKAQVYEFCISLCHIFIKIYERLTRFKKLSSVFNRISDLYSRIKNIVNKFFERHDHSKYFTPNKQFSSSIQYQQFSSSIQYQQFSSSIQYQQFSSSIQYQQFSSSIQYQQFSSSIQYQQFSSPICLSSQYFFSQLKRIQITKKEKSLCILELGFIPKCCEKLLEKSLYISKALTHKYPILKQD